MANNNEKIDAGKAFDFGKTSADYAAFRDIYPEVFYEKIAKRNLCVKGQRVLDLGTGTAVLPRNMYHYGAQWVATDVSPNQIAQAERIAAANNQNIEFLTLAAEDIDFSAFSFDLVTACQCYWYFDYEKLVPKLAHVLKRDGQLLFVNMAWLPLEDEIAAASEKLVLKYSPDWSGAGEVKKPIELPDTVLKAFQVVHSEEYELYVPFTRETWNGRMKTCRGIGASLQKARIDEWEKEHKLLLKKIAPDSFTVKHYAAMVQLKLRNKESLID